VEAAFRPVEGISLARVYFRVEAFLFCFNFSILSCPGWSGRQPVGSGNSMAVPLVGGSFQMTFPFHPNFGGSTTGSGSVDTSRKEAAGSIQIAYPLPANVPGNPHVPAS
jgi:hypothetical protein